MESCSRIKDGNGRLAQGWDGVRRCFKKYFEDLYNIDTEEQVAVHICDFYGIWRGNYVGGQPIGRAEVEVRIGKLKKGKATCKDEITEEMIKGGGDRVLDWIQRLCNMAFESVVVPKYWKYTVMFHCARVKERGLNLVIIEVLAC